MGILSAPAGSSLFESGGGCNYQVQYIRDRRALPITRDYMAEAEARYRKIAAEIAPAKRAPSAGRAKRVGRSAARFADAIDPMVLREAAIGK